MTRGARSGLAIIAFVVLMVWLANERRPFTSPNSSAQPVYDRPAPVSGTYYGPDGKEIAPPPPAISKPAQPQRRRRSFIPDEGSVVRLYDKGRTVVVGTDKKALDEFGEAGRVGDDYGARLLVLSRRIVMVESGTRARVLDIGFFTHEVRILEGGYKGARVWVLKEFVSR